VAIAERIETHGSVVRHHTARLVPGPLKVWVSCYVTGDVLVDSGMPHARREVERFLAARPIATCLTTHEHEDHVGNHDLLRDVEIHAPPIASSYLEAGTPPFPRYRRFFWGMPRGRGITSRAPEATVHASGRRFRVIDAAGHSDDHVAYFDEVDGALFSGDSYMGKFRAARLAEDIATEIATLRRMADLDPAVLYPAHGPILERPRAKLIETAEHFEDLQRRARRLADKGEPERKIARELLGREPIITLVSMGEFSHLNMVRNLLREKR
jgi:glyoxylase-like metal-dependent hydrolase (beta-lactamase superfamily II)